MNRRDFLKVLGISTTAAIIPVRALAKPAQRVPTANVEIPDVPAQNIDAYKKQRHNESLLCLNGKWYTVHNIKLMESVQLLRVPDHWPLVCSTYDFVDIENMNVGEVDFVLVLPEKIMYEGVASVTSITMNAGMGSYIYTDISIVSKNTLIRTG